MVEIKFELADNIDKILQNIFNDVNIFSYDLNILISDIYIESNGKYKNTWDLYQEEEITKIFIDDIKQNILELLLVMKKESDVIYLYIYDSLYGKIILSNDSIYNQIHNNLKKFKNFKNIKVHNEEERILDDIKYILQFDN